MHHNLLIFIPQPGGCPPLSSPPSRVFAFTNFTMLVSPFTLLPLLSLNALIAPVWAGSNSKGMNCSQSASKLQAGTYEFWSQCDSLTYCAANSTCLLRGCRVNQFPLGYPQDDPSLPSMCKQGMFCPDEMDACLPQMQVGSACQLNRDDQCQPQPGYTPSSATIPGSSNSGTVCLNYQCQYKNATQGQNCTVENTAYVAYGSDDQEFLNIVSRDNCKDGLYCDSQTLICNGVKELSASCSADKECGSFNCLASGVCGSAPWAPKAVGAWVYVVCAIGIFGGMIATLVTLFFFHRKHRDAEREKRAQYWREQSAFRQNIIQMRESAIGSLNNLAHFGSGNSNRSTMYAASEHSQTPILHSAQKSGSGGSRLRHNVSDDGTEDEEIMMHSPMSNGMNRI